MGWAQSSASDNAVSGWASTLNEPSAPLDIKNQRRAALRTAIREQKAVVAAEQKTSPRQLSPQERFELRRQLRQHKTDMRN